MDVLTIALLIILILAVIAAALSWRSPVAWLCVIIAAIALLLLIPGGPL